MATSLTLQWPLSSVPKVAIGGQLATGREHQLTTGKRIERTKHNFRCPICRSAIAQAICLICARPHQLTFLFCS